MKDVFLPRAGLSWLINPKTTLRGGFGIYASRAVDQQPNDTEALKLLVSTQGKFADWHAASATYERILASKNDDAEALLGLGHSQAELKDSHAAIDTLNRLLSIDPANAQAHYYLARAFLSLGDTKEAQHQSVLHHAMMQQESFSASALGTEQDRIDPAVVVQVAECRAAMR